MGAYQLKITLKGSKPPIWRRILVPDGITFEGLHQVIQTVFSWRGKETYQFQFRSEKIQISPCEDGISKKFTSIPVDKTMDSFVSDTSKFTYIFDRNNQWEHTIQVEEILPDRKESFAKVVKYKGDVIPEDCGSLLELHELFENFPERIKKYDMEAVNNILSRGTSFAGEEVMRNYFLCVRDSEIRLFEQLLSGDLQTYISKNDKLDYLYAGGYLTTGDDLQLVIPQEVAQRYHDMNTPEFQMERSRQTRIGDYLFVSNSLYRITPPSVILETFNKYEEKKLTKEELMEAYEKLLPYRCGVTWLDGCFVDTELVEKNEYKNFLDHQKKVPYYIPTRQEIRFMAYNEGFLMTPELERLGEFLKDKIHAKEDQIISLLRQIHDQIRIGGEFDEVMDDWKELGIIFDEGEEAKSLAKLASDVRNHTRIAFNRGHKPYEMALKGLEEVSRQRRIIAKVYPNAPCPCGSGKKFKKCCFN